MANKWNELKEYMNPEAQARVDARVDETVSSLYVNTSDNGEVYPMERFKVPIYNLDCRSILEVIHIFGVIYDYDPNATIAVEEGEDGNLYLVSEHKVKPCSDD